MAVRTIAAATMQHRRRDGTDRVGTNVLTIKAAEEPGPFVAWWRDHCPFHNRARMQSKQATAMTAAACGFGVWVGGKTDALLDEPEVHRVAEELALAGFDHRKNHECQEAEADNHQPEADNSGDSEAGESGKEAHRKEANDRGDTEVQRLFAMSVQDGAGAAFPKPHDERKQMCEHGEGALFVSGHGTGTEGRGIFQFELNAAGGGDGGLVHGGCRVCGWVISE